MLWFLEFNDGCDASPLQSYHIMTYRRGPIKKKRKIKWPGKKMGHYEP